MEFVASTLLNVEMDNVDLRSINALAGEDAMKNVLIAVEIILVTTLVNWSFVN